MDAATIEQLDLGVTFHPEREPSVLVWAPRARELSIEIVGKKTFPFLEERHGYWHTSCPGLQPGDRYLITINGKNSYPDPASLSQPEGIHGPSACIDRNAIRKIRDEQWTGISTRDLILYELHVGTFTREGTFMAMHEKLDYLTDLGINAIEIMPVASFPGTRNWGYDGVFPFAVQHTYGGAMEFAKLIKACHSKGIAVILDVVYNHLGPEGNCLNAFGPYFTGKYKTPWGKAINFDGARCDGVRRYFLENAMMWLRDFHIDGLRLDAVHAIKDKSSGPFLQELSQQVQKRNQTTRASHFLIAESDHIDTRYIDPPDQGGYGLDALWYDEWHHALHAVLTGERQGYYADFGSLQHLVQSFNCSLNNDEPCSARPKNKGGPSTALHQGQRFVVYTQNHDQVGNRMTGERLSNLIDFESLKLAAGAMFASPFIPLLFMGEEYAESNPFLYFIHHGNEKLVSKVRKGRKREFRGFHKDAEPPDPAAEETFLRSKLQWDFSDDPSKQTMHAYYRKLIALRKEHPMLTPGKRDRIRAFRPNNQEAVVLVRQNQKERLLAIMNFSEKPIATEIPDGQRSGADVLIYSAHRQWGGNIRDSESPVSEHGGKLSAILAKRSFLLCTIT